MLIRICRCARSNFFPGQLGHCGVMALGLCKNGVMYRLSKVNTVIWLNLVRRTTPSVSTWITWYLAYMLTRRSRCVRSNFCPCQLSHSGVMALELCKNAVMCRNLNVKQLIYCCKNLYIQVLLQFQPESLDTWHKC